MNRETAPRFAGIGGHHSPVAGTVEWLTPPWVIDALGGPASFDLDPCAPAVQPYPTARRTFTAADNGLIQRWEGRVWLNPPYSSDEIGLWLGRMAEHGRGSAILFARTETDAFFRHIWERATALLFMRGRVHFHHGDGTRAKRNSGAPTVLCAYGMEDAEVLAYCGIAGAFVPLRIPRAVVVMAVEQTWIDAVVEWCRGRDGPIRLEDLYRDFARHPKAARNDNWRAKLRQVLQRGPFERRGRAEWEAVG